jgi:hypothetical protein
MASWEDVGKVALGLPETAVGEAHEGSPAFPSAVLAWLDQLDTDEVQEIVTDSWQVRVPMRVVKAHPEVS